MLPTPCFPRQPFDLGARSSPALKPYFTSISRFSTCGEIFPAAET
jgi:hypothetical protein